MDKSTLPASSPIEQEEIIDLTDPVIPLEEPAQEDSILLKDSSVCFDDTTLEYKPLEKKGFQKYEDMFFNLLHGRKNKPIIPKNKKAESSPFILAQKQPKVLFDIPNPATIATSQSNIPIIRKKTLSETVRDQLKFPQVSKLTAVTNGLALAGFAIGSYILYSQLPTRPLLVIGIILVSIAGNVVISSR